MLMKPGNYLILLVLPAMVVTGFYLGGYFNFMTPFFCFIVYPLANVFLHSSDNKIPMEAVQPSTAYKFIAFLFVPVLIFLTLWCVRKAGNENLTIVEISGLVISLGIINGVLGFTLAHEFIHRFTKPEQIAGYSLLLQNNYMHYGIEHVWGHHVYACTAEDPNTARYNESIYTFLPRSIIYSYLSALKIERKRLERRKYTTPWLHNRM
jgi:alkane 1-monooxygenase